MKNIFVLILSVFFTVSFVEAQTKAKTNYEIKAKISGLNASKIEFRIVNKENPKGKWINSDVNKDHFTYKGYVAEPTLMYFNFDDNAVKKYSSPDKRGYFMSPVSLLVFVASPNIDVKVNGKMSGFINAYPSGDFENITLAKLTSKLHPVLNKSMDLLTELGDKSLSKEKVDELKALRKPIDQEINNIKLEFVKKNISSIAGLSTCRSILGSLISVDEAPKYFNKISSKYKTSRYYKELMERYHNLISERKNKELTKEGAAVPEIKTTNTLDGKEFNLKSLRGKYVLLDFWGTWCGACVNGMPHMKAFRDKHKSKFQILGIAQESRNLSPWRNLIKSKGLNWPHIYVGKSDSNYVKLFGISAFPTKILISPEGKILLRHVGEDPEFYKELEKIIK